jgi:hypothetical protein
MLRVKHTFFAPDGSNVCATTVGEAMDAGDKASNKAMSAAMKYALIQVLCIPTEGDNDTENNTPPDVTPKATLPAANPADQRSEHEIFAATWKDSVVKRGFSGAVAAKAMSLAAAKLKLSVEQIAGQTGMNLLMDLNSGKLDERMASIRFDLFMDTSIATAVAKSGVTEKVAMDGIGLAVKATGMVDHVEKIPADTLTAWYKAIVDGRFDFATGTIRA